jgi:hypothetical protein
LSPYLLGLPILMVAQEEVFVPVVERRGQEKSRDAQVPHLLEAAIGGINAAAHDPEFAARHLLAQMVVLGKVHLFVKFSQLVEALPFKEHEHPGTERMVYPGKILKDIVAGVKQLVGETSLAAKDVGCHTVQFLALGQFEGTTHQRRAGRFDIGVKKKDIGRVGTVSAGVPARRGQAAGNYADIKPIAEGHDNCRSSVGGVSISDQYSRIPHLRVILIRQRVQQARNQPRLVLCRNHNG